MSSSAPAIMSTTADDVRRRGLRRMRTVAVSLLALAAVVYILTLDRGGGWGYLHAASEAAMSGHRRLVRRHRVVPTPTGSPDPAHGVVPTRKDTLARSLQEFVTDNFLSGPVVRDKVLRAMPAERLDTGSPAWNTAAASSTRQRSWCGPVSVGSETRMSRPSSVMSCSRLADEPLSAIAGQLLGDIVEEGAHHGRPGRQRSARLAGRQRGDLRQRPDPALWWTPQWLDDKVVGRMHHEAIAWVADIRDSPHHHARVALDDFLRQTASRPKHDADTMARAGAARPGCSASRRSRRPPRAVASIEQGHPGEPRGSREHTAVPGRAPVG